jgi:serine/threonine protein kinase
MRIGDTSFVRTAAFAPADQRGVLGDFRILREIGCGGMGVVYEAEQISLGRRVALKVLPFATMLDPRQVLRFQNESRAAASLDHPNIVKVYSVGSDRGVMGQFGIEPPTSRRQTGLIWQAAAISSMVSRAGRVGASWKNELG